MKERVNDLVKEDEGRQTNNKNEWMIFLYLPPSLWSEMKKADLVDVPKLVERKGKDFKKNKKTNKKKNK